MELIKMKKVMTKRSTCYPLLKRKYPGAERIFEEWNREGSFGTGGPNRK